MPKTLKKQPIQLGQKPNYFLNRQNTQNAVYQCSATQTRAVPMALQTLHLSSQDKELNAMPLKKNVKTRPVYGNGDYPCLLWGFFAHFDYFLQINSRCERCNYRQNHFGICGIFCKYFRARALRMSTGQSGYSALFCSIVDSTTLCTALYQSQCEAAGLNNSLAMCPGLPK